MPEEKPPKHHQEETIFVNKAHIVFMQDADCEDRKNNYQEFLIELQDNDFVTISTQRWALNFDEVDEFFQKVKTVIEAINVKIKK